MYKTYVCKLCIAYNKR